ncbi:MAG: DUF4342 domain-containing protein [Bacillota bacterium]|jgi:uncharacterized Fe-S cluster-containing protein
MTDELYKIDIIRERLGVSYKEAQEALNEAGGDVVAAIVNLESQERSFEENFEERKEKLVNQVQSILKKGNVTKIKVKKGNKVITEIPAAVGALGVVGIVASPPFAVLAGLGTIAAMLNDYTLEIEKKDGETEEHEIKL